LPLRQIRAATIFTDPITTIIHKMKYEGFFGLADLLADLMVEAWPRWQVVVDGIVPVPLHPDREKKRGYNQSALLAKRLGKQLGLVYAPGFLRRIRYTQPQVGLNAADRLTNVKDAFAVATGEVAGKHILLVDDVCTTGATMAAAAQALLAGGACSVSGYCVARAM
jgi:ComF family protein